MLNWGLARTSIDIRASAGNCARNEKGGLPKGRPPISVSVNAPKGCDLLLFFSRSSSLGVGSGRSSSGRSSSGVSSRSGSSVGASSGSVGTGSGGIGASSSGVSAFFRNSFSSRSFGGGGFVSSLFTASGEGEHAGSNGDSSKLLHDLWAP